jgi:hypothetical protein
VSGFLHCATLALTHTYTHHTIHCHHCLKFCSQVIKAEEAERRRGEQRLKASLEYKQELESQIVQARLALAEPDESELERRLNATLLETYRTKAATTRRAVGGFK